MSNTIIDLVEKLKENKNSIKDFADVLNTNANLSREIMLGDIDEDTGEAVESVIRFWNRYDDEKEKEFYLKASNQEIIPGFFKREPIKIYIDSYGGCMTATFTMIDAIKKSKTPVYTYNIGTAYSGGFFTFICGHKRFSYEHSTFLFHEGSTGIRSDAGKFRNYSDFYNKQLEQLEKITIENTKITKEEYEKHRNDDWWLLASEAIEKGICDEIL